MLFHHPGDNLVCLAEQEELRLRALQDLDLLETPESESFDRITRMASRVFQTPVSAMSLTDRNRQWFKSHVGTNGREIPRFKAPCAEVTRSNSFLLIEDMLQDGYFADSPLANSGIRFYAGAPLTTREGHTLGAMCVLDTVPRMISPEEQASLHDFAAMVMSQIELQHDFGRVDPLSGLPNRHQLTEDLENLERDHPGENRVLVVIDMAEPRQFNHLVSVLGAVYIDDLIRASRKVIQETLGHKAGLYAHGSGAFVLLIDETQGRTWREIVGQLVVRLKTPVICKGIPVTIDVAFGVSPICLDGTASKEALRTAVSAVHDARRSEQDFAVYSLLSDRANYRRFALLTDIRHSLTQPNDFSLAFQPRVDLRTGECCGAEALLRWNSSRLGSVSPGEFIPVVEQTALTQPVTEWVIDAALRQLAVWHAAGRKMRVSINVSPVDLENPSFAARLNDALTQYGVPASALEIEFTEGALIRNSGRVLEQLKQLRELNIDLAIDDFGTGYSAFSYLKTIPANTVKLDQSFMRHLAENSQDQKLVHSMIVMAHDLGYRVVAEGVETEQVYQFLAAHGCDEAQGYWMSRPLTPEALELWLMEQEAARRAGLASAATAE